MEFALQNGAFDNDNEKKTARALVKRMNSNRTTGGRHEQVLAILRRGATIEQMMKAASASRRTVFRYLNHLEEVDFEIVVTDGVYKVK